MSVVVDFNEYLDGNLKDWKIEEASKNLPKELFIEIQNNSASKVNLSVLTEFDFWFCPRKLNENFASVSKEKLISDEDLTEWCKTLENKNKSIFVFHKKFKIKLDKIPKDITLLDMVISQEDSNLYNFSKIVLDFMKEKTTEIEYVYTPKFESASIILLGTLARSDTNEWKFFPKFKDGYGDIFKKVIMFP